MEVSAVRLMDSYQICFVRTNNLFVRHNTLCIIETENGIDIGRVCKSGNYQKSPSTSVSGKLLRKTTAEDLAVLPEIESIEQKAFNTCRDKARDKNLNMKLISVKCLFDRTKIIFYFVAENRIDFRELVRDLASIFRTRIEMRQIGVRDEARLVGGYGPCGKELCCVHQREEFEPVSIRMAKEQDLNINSLKISGMCGRLLCCLAYEYATYREINRSLPFPGSEIFVADKKYTVTGIDTLKEQVRIRFGDRTLEISGKELDFSNNRYSLKKEILERILHKDDEQPEEEEEKEQLLY